MNVFLLLVACLVLGFAGASSPPLEPEVIVENEAQPTETSNETQWLVDNDVKEQQTSPAGTSPWPEPKTKTLREGRGLLRSDKLKAQAAQELKAQLKAEDNVIVLNETTLDKALSVFPVVIVEFYAPWCSHCQKFSPEYSKAAKALKDNSTIVLARFSVTSDLDRQASSRYNVIGFPTLKLFQNGNFIVDFVGSKTAYGVVKWVNRLAEPIVELHETEDADAFDKLPGLLITGFFPSGNNQEYQQLSLMFPDAKFAIISDQFMQNYQVGSQDMVMIQRADAVRVPLLDEDLLRNRTALEDIVKEHSILHFTEITEYNARILLEGKIGTFVILVGSHESVAYQEMKVIMETISPEYSEKIKFIYSGDPKSESFQRFAGPLGILPTRKHPTVRLFELKAGPPSSSWDSYQLNSSDETSVDDLRNFIEDFYQNKLPRFRKIEKLPSDWNHRPVKILTVENFVKVTSDSTKDVLVKFQLPTCKHCQALEPRYEYLATKVIKDKNIWITKINVAKNDLDGIDIKKYPTIWLYKRESKEPVEFTGTHTIKDMYDFVTSRGEKQGDSSFQPETAASTATETIESVKEEL